MLGGVFLYKRKFREENKKENRKEDTVTDYDDTNYGGKGVYDTEETDYYVAKDNYYDDTEEYYKS